MSRLIKRYDNRKLYDTDSKRYISLREIADQIRAGEDVSVVDNATGADLTTQTLAKIIVEEQPSLEPVFLHGLLRWGGKMIDSGREQLHEGIDRLIETSVERLSPVRELRGDVARLRERVRALEALIQDLEVKHGTDQRNAPL